MAVQHGFPEIQKVSKTRYLTIKIVSADFAAARKKTAEKSLLPSKKDIRLTSVIDAKENEHTSIQCTVVFFCFGDEIYDDILPLNYQCQFHNIAHYKFL